MKSLKLCLVVFSFVLLSNSTYLLAGEKDTWSDVEKLSQSKPVKKNSIEAIGGNGEGLIAKSFAAKKSASVTQLIAILRNKKLSATARIAAAKMLGTLRAPEAVDPLMEQLSTLQPMFSFELSWGPCYAALCQIGKPASRKALVLLQREKDSYRKLLLRRILSKVEGREVATFLVKAEIKKTKDKEVRARLEAALRKM